MIYDWKTYRFENVKFSHVYHDENGNKRCFEIVGYNIAGQELARGFTILQYLANRKSRQEKRNVF